MVDPLSWPPELLFKYAQAATQLLQFVLVIALHPEERNRIFYSLLWLAYSLCVASLTDFGHFDYNLFTISQCSILTNLFTLYCFLSNFFTLCGLSVWLIHFVASLIYIFTLCSLSVCHIHSVLPLWLNNSLSVTPLTNSFSLWPLLQPYSLLVASLTDLLTQQILFFWLAQSLWHQLLIYSF